MLDWRNRGIVVNQALPSLQGGSLKITQTVPFTFISNL